MAELGLGAPRPGTLLADGCSLGALFSWEPESNVERLPLLQLRKCRAIGAQRFR